VRLQLEYTGSKLSGFVRANTFEYTHAIVKGVCQYVNLGIAPIDHLSIKPDEAVSVGKGHFALLQ
jgi:hypothetical protein